jgi:hypothetical protein
MIWRKYRRPRRRPRGVTQTLAAMVALGVSLGAASSASGAESFYWYGENGGTCWQTGQLGSSSSACDSVGVGYLNTGHQVEGGIAAQVALATSGDYCGYYRLGDDLTAQDSSNESANTGYATPTPYSSYQESDTHQNVCQAYGSHWGQEIRDAAPGNKCSETCGMNHYVSFAGQGTADRPWGSVFGEPTLVVSAEANPQILNRTGSKTNLGGWGYVCPVLKDTATGYILEYCLQEWRSKYNTAEWAEERVGTCAGGDGTAIDTIQSYFAPGTRFVTQYSGSPNTFVFEKEGWRHFEGGITKADLENAIAADNATCGRGNSTNPQNYALIGVEQGLEGWRELALEGGSAANLQLRTEYTPLPPEASTSEASEVQSTQAKLSGTVNPVATDTHYYFQYGTTTEYGSTTTSTDVGSGTTPVPVSVTVAGLAEAVTYHYRVVATNSDGMISYGSPQTFTTQEAEKSSRWVARNPLTTEQWVFYRGSTGNVNLWAWSGTEWVLGELSGHAIAANTSPTVVRNQSNSEQWVFFQGSNGNIDLWTWNGKEWVFGELNGHAAKAGTSPTVVRNRGNGEQWVYFQGSNGNIDLWTWNGKTWLWGELGGHAAAASTSPTAVRSQSNGEQWVYFQGSNGNIDLWSWNGKEWVLGELGGHTAAASTSLSAVRNRSNGEQRVYFQGSNANIELWTWSSKEWVFGEFGSHAAKAGTSPTVVQNEGNGEQWVYYQGSNGDVDLWSWNGKEWGWGERGGHTAAASASPTVVRDPNSGEQWVYFAGTSGAISLWGWNGSTWQFKEL